MKDRRELLIDAYDRLRHRRSSINDIDDHHNFIDIISWEYEIIRNRFWFIITLKLILIFAANKTVRPVCRRTQMLCDCLRN